MKTLTTLSLALAVITAVGLPVEAQALSVNENTRLDADGSLRYNSTSTEISANAEASLNINNSNYLETLQQRRAEWRNENQSGTSSQQGALLRDRNRDRVSQNDREEFLTELRERRQEFAEERAEIRSQNRINAALSIEARQRIENFANGLFERLNSALERLESIADRIETKIDELESEGNDLSVESEMLADARVSLEAAETEAVEAELALEAMLASENPREELPTLRTAVKEAKDAIRNTQQELMGVIQSIKLTLSAETEIEASLEN